MVGSNELGSVPGVGTIEWPVAVNVGVMVGPGVIPNEGPGADLAVGSGVGPDELSSIGSYVGP